MTNFIIAELQFYTIGFYIVQVEDPEELTIVPTQDDIEIETSEGQGDVMAVSSCSIIQFLAVVCPAKGNAEYNIA